MILHLEKFVTRFLSGLCSQKMFNTDLVYLNGATIQLTLLGKSLEEWYTLVYLKPSANPEQ